MLGGPRGGRSSGRYSPPLRHLRRAGAASNVKTRCELLLFTFSGHRERFMTSKPRQQEQQQQEQEETLLSSRGVNGAQKHFNKFDSFYSSAERQRMRRKIFFLFAASISPPSFSLFSLLFIQCTSFPFKSRQMCHSVAVYDKNRNERNSQRVPPTLPDRRDGGVLP